MFDATTARLLTRKNMEKSVQKYSIKEYDKLLDFVFKYIVKSCKKGQTCYYFETTCLKENVDKLEKDLNKMGYKVIVMGPFICDDVCCFNINKEVF